jgi:hypothetical protein
MWVQPEPEAWASARIRRTAAGSTGYTCPGVPANRSGTGGKIRSPKQTVTGVSNGRVSHEVTVYGAAVLQSV